MSAARNEGRCGSFAAGYKPVHGGYPGVVPTTCCATVSNIPRPLCPNCPMKPARETIEACMERNGVDLSQLESKLYALYNSGDLSESEFNVARACIEVVGDAYAQTILVPRIPAVGVLH